MASLQPGPTPLPFVGHLPDVQKNPYLAFGKWRQQFGSVFTIWWGEQPVVVLADYETFRQTLVKDGESFSGRYTYGRATASILGGCYGILETEGAQWTEQRRFAVSVLRSMGELKPSAAACS